MNEKELYTSFKKFWDDDGWRLKDYLYIRILHWIDFVELCRANNVAILWLEFLTQFPDWWIQPFDYDNYSDRIISDSWDEYVNSTCTKCINKIKTVIANLKDEWIILDSILIDFNIASENGYKELGKKE